MRFLLITHGIETNMFQGTHWLSLGFCYIGALLKQNGHDVQVFDRYASIDHLGHNIGKIDHDMLETIKKFSPDVVGLNTVTPMIHDAVHCAKIIRDIFPGIMLAGGHHATALPVITLEKIPELDGIGIGEGEETLLSLAEGVKPGDINGIVWRQNLDKKDTAHETYAAGFGHVEQLDMLPFPDFSLFDMDFYTRRTSSTIRGFHLSTLSMLGSRGCNNRCSFCTESLTYGRGVRFHSVEYMTEMIERSLRQYPRVEGIYFHDNDFLIDYNRVEQFCQRLIKTGLAKQFLWAIQTRTDRLEQNLLRLMRKAGCIKMEIGIEAVTQNKLDDLQKGTTVEANEKALRLCRDAGISVHAYILTRIENESLADLNLTLEWLKTNLPDTFSIHPLLRYPGSMLYKETGENFFETNDWTRENVLSFYNEDVFSKVTPHERRCWTQSQFAPFQKNHHRFIRFKLNPVKKWPQMLYEAVLKRLKSVWSIFRTV